MKVKASLIKSSRVSTKFCNPSKLAKLENLEKEYGRIVNQFIKILWSEGLEKIPIMLPSSYTSQIKDSWLSARIIQCAGKQASGIVRGNFAKQKKRIFIYNKLLKENKSKRAKKLKTIIESVAISIPEIKLIPMELDSRFFKVDWESETSFDGWITLTCLGNKEKLVFPFKKTKHFNKLFSKGKIKSSIRISSKEVSFCFEWEVKKKEEGKTIGLDIGFLEVYNTSDGQKSKSFQGHTLNSICTKLSNKKKGSKAFERTQKLRENFINWSINQLNLTGINEVKREDIKNLRKGTRTSKVLGSWTYTNIFDKLESHCYEQGVLVRKVSPTYTSQRCSVCGWTRKKNRKGKIFTCDKCGTTLDSDLNASRNISFELPWVSKEERLLHKNIKGFYWNVKGQECIVPVVQEKRSFNKTQNFP